MKNILLFTFTSLLILACGKKNPSIYTASLSQSGEMNPIETILGKKNSKKSISWKRNGPGIYEGTTTGFLYTRTFQTIDPGSNVNQEIRIHVNKEYVQVYTREWNDELKEWEFSDDVLNNTSIRIEFYK